MKYIDIVSERQFNMIAHDIDEDTRAELWGIWRDDLNTRMSQDQLISYANGLLAYFGSKVLVSDVQWDERGNCFLWEIQFDQPC
jgi:hypothetical protein